MIYDLCFGHVINVFLMAADEFRSNNYTALQIKIKQNQTGFLCCWQQQQREN